MNGSSIDLQSYDQDVALFESADYDWAAFDEPPPRPIWVAVQRGLTDRRGPSWIAMTPLKATYQQLALHWGITPMLCPLGKTTDEMLGYGERILLKTGLVKHGETTLVTAGGTAKHKASNMLKVHVVGSLTYR